METIHASTDHRLPQTDDDIVLRIGGRLNAAVISEVSSNTVPHDLAPYGAILGSIEQPGKMAARAAGTLPGDFGVS